MPIFEFFQAGLKRVHACEFPVVNDKYPVACYFRPVGSEWLLTGTVEHAVSRCASHFSVIFNAEVIPELRLPSSNFDFEIVPTLNLEGRHRLDILTCLAAGRVREKRTTLVSRNLRDLSQQASGGNALPARWFQAVHFSGNASGFTIWKLLWRDCWLTCEILVLMISSSFNFLNC